MRGRRGWGRRAAATVAGLALLAGIAGCGTDEPTIDQSPPLTTPEPAPTPTPSPTVDLTQFPAQPDAMREPTTDGALAAATYVLQLYGYTFASGDAGPWSAFAADSCGFCTEVTSSVSDMVAAGETSSGSTFAVTSAESKELGQGRWFSVDMTIVQSPSERYDKDEKVIGTGTGGVHRAVFALSWAEGWKLDEMGILPIEESGAASE